jgi:hypothetical protein
MRIRFRYSLTTLLLLPLLVGLGIKWYRGPHQYALEEEREWLRAEDEKDSFVYLCGGFDLFEKGTFWAYRNFDGSFTRHGPEIKVTMFDKQLVEYKNGKRHGHYRAWDPDGTLCCTGQYEFDEPIGEWLYYGESVFYERVQYVRNEQQAIESHYQLGRLAERRVKALETDEVSLTAWHSNGQKRLDGRFAGERPIGIWRWWEGQGRGMRTVIFDGGIPAELVGLANVETFFDAPLYVNVQEVPLEEVLLDLAEQGFPFRIEADDEQAAEIKNRSISTCGDLNGGLELYLALRDAGLTLEIRAETDGTETLVLLPAEGE